MAWRASAHVASLAFGVTGAWRPPDSKRERPRVGFQAYALHLAQFQEPLIQRLAEDRRIDLFFVVLSHPHFTGEERRGLRELAIERWGLPSSRVVPYWQALWWPFDIMFYADVYAAFPLRRTRTCLTAHGTALTSRHFTQRWPRKTLFDFDMVLPSGPFDSRLIVHEQCRLRRGSVIKAVGCPQLDQLFTPPTTRAEYLRWLDLPTDCAVVLYAPHWTDLDEWGAQGTDRMNDVIEALLVLPVSLVLKPHSMSYSSRVSNGPDWRRVVEGLCSERVKVDSDINDTLALCHADVLITGFSSRRFSFALLDKPAVLFPTAGGEVHPIDWQRWSIGRDAFDTADDLPSLVAAVSRALMEPEARSAARRVCANELFANPGRATEAMIRVIYDELGLRESR